MTCHLNSDAVQDRMKERGIPSISALSRKADIPQSVLSRAMSHERTPSVSVLLKLQLILGLSFEELLTVTAAEPPKAA